MKLQILLRQLIDILVFRTQLADGIMGLNNGDKSFVTLLYKNKIISKHLFSICLGQDDGYFSIGDIETSHHKTDIEYIEKVTTNGPNV